MALPPSATNMSKIFAVLHCFTSKRTYFSYSKSLSQPTKKQPTVLPAEKIFQTILKSGQTIFSQGAAATPVILLDAMADVALAQKLNNITLYSMHTEGATKFASTKCKGVIRTANLFMGANVRQAVMEGFGDAIPICLQDIPKIFHRKIVKPNISLIHVSPPDKHGYCSLGTSVDCVRAALLNTEIIVAQVNPRMPRTFGDSIIHSSHIDFCCDVDAPLPQHAAKEATENEKKIGKLIADNLVVDGATLQMGIGSIPDAVLQSLHHHKDLAIHSEMFSVGVIQLVKNGCITNSQRRNHKGRIVASFLVGNQALYDFVDNNPFIDMMEIDYVNSTHIISLLPKMTAINSCIEVDLTGQVCSDSIGTRMYSGFGGQMDFIRGAAESKDCKGKPILAFESVTRKGKSKIVPILTPGAGVVSTRAHVNYLVTENGIANLFGKTLRQRAFELIKIAHPKHQAWLEKEAFARLKTMPSPLP